MRLPTMYRKKRGGRQVGSWRAMVKGKEVNLGTSDAEEARTRLRAAVERGRRNFDDEAELAADLEGTSQEGQAPRAETIPASSPISETGSAAAPAPSLSPPPAPPVLEQPLPFEQPAPANDVGEADAMAAAAAEVAAGQTPANDNAAAAAPIDTAVLDAMLEQGASVIVDLQLQLQAYAIKRGTGLVAGAIPSDSVLRTGAAKAWAQQLKIWFPSAAQLPPWAMAIILPVMAIPAQLEGARPMTKEEKDAEARKEEKHEVQPMAAAQ